MLTGDRPLSDNALACMHMGSCPAGDADALRSPPLTLQRGFVADRSREPLYSQHVGGYLRRLGPEEAAEWGGRPRLSGDVVAARETIAAAAAIVPQVGVWAGGPWREASSREPDLWPHARAPRRSHPAHTAGLCPLHFPSAALQCATPTTARPPAVGPAGAPARPLAAPAARRLRARQPLRAAGPHQVLPRRGLGCERATGQVLACRHVLFVARGGHVLPVWRRASGRRGSRTPDRACHMFRGCG